MTMVDNTKLSMVFWLNKPESQARLVW